MGPFDKGRNGAGGWWILDLRTLQVYANRDAHWLLLDTLSVDDAVTRPPYDAITFGLAALWPSELTCGSSAKDCRPTCTAPYDNETSA